MEENKRLSTRSGYCQGCACVVCMTSAISWPNCVFAVGSIMHTHFPSVDYNVRMTTMRSTIKRWYLVIYLHRDRLNFTTFVFLQFIDPSDHQRWIVRMGVIRLGIVQWGVVRLHTFWHGLIQPYLTRLQLVIPKVRYSEGPLFRRFDSPKIK